MFVLKTHEMIYLSGTIISYATSNNDNELLVLVTKQALLIMIHNVPFFVKKG